MRKSLVIVITFLILSLWILWGALSPFVSQTTISLGKTLASSNISNTLAEIEPNDVSTTGQWGDSFGALNALFAGLAFTAALGALIIQGQAIDRQNREYHRQRFESSFFELLSLLRKVRSEVQFRYSANYIKARARPEYKVSRQYKTDIAAFRSANFEMMYLSNKLDMDSDQYRLNLAKIYKKGIHKRFESTFGPYFRIVYTILKRIRDDKFLNEDEKIQYANLLRSQLTSQETSLAGFNALMKEANDFHELLTEFHMLKYLPEGNRRRILTRVYPSSAFSPRND